MTLLKTQKNAIFKLVEGAGLNPRECQWEMRDAEGLGFPALEAETVVHVPSGFYCMIENAHVRQSSNVRVYEGAGDYLLNYEPGEESRVETVTGLSLQSALDRIRTWAMNVQRETSEPDLWAQLVSEGELFSSAIGAVETANTPFSPDERKLIADGLDQVRAQLVARGGLSEQVLAAIDVGFTALRAASERVGRKDWVLMLGGVLMGIIGNAALPPELVRGIFHTVGQVFAWLLQQGHLLPPFP